MTLFPRRVLPILMYHRFGTPDGGDPELWVTPEKFTRQLRWLSRHGFRTLTLDEAYKALAQNRVPRRAVLITIDDGFGEDLDRAAELLESEGATAAIFVPAGLLGESVDLNHPAGDDIKTSTGTIASVDELRRWIARGFGVGCHSMTHRDLTTCDPEALDYEVQQARAQLTALLGRSIDDFCYPFAHHNEASRRAVKAAGFRAAYAGEPPHDNVLAIPRMMVYPGDDEARFRRKVSGHYYWISGLHQQLRRFMGN